MCIRDSSSGVCATARICSKSDAVLPEAKYSLTSILASADSASAAAVPSCVSANFSRAVRCFSPSGSTATRVVIPLAERDVYKRQLSADAKIDVNEYFASGKTASDFEQILAEAQTPLEMAIAALSVDTPDADLARVLGPLLAEVGQLDPILQPRLLKQIQEKCGKDRLPITALRKQMKVVRIDSKKKAGGKRPGAARSPGPQLAVAAQPSANWRDLLLLNLNSTVKPLLANACLLYTSSHLCWIASTGSVPTVPRMRTRSATGSTPRR